MLYMPYVVCAIALRYSDKSAVYPIAGQYAKDAVTNTLIDGRQTVELCQAYILMSTYGIPARRWEEDRTWLYTDLAIRCACVHENAERNDKSNVVAGILEWRLVCTCNTCLRGSRQRNRRR